MNRSPELSTSAAASELLGLALHFPMARVTVLSGLEEELLARPEERALLRIAQRLWEKEIDFSLIDIETALRRLIERSEFGSASQNYQSAIDLLAERYAAPPLETHPGRRSEELIAALRRVSPLAVPRLVRCSEIVGQVLQDATEAHEARVSGTLRAPVTGFKGLDEKIGGALPKAGTCIVLGNTGTGKTAFAMQIAAMCGFPALFVTTEMTPAELFRRQMARVTGTFLGRLKSGEMAPREIEAMAARTAQAMPDLSFVDSTTAFASPTYLRECAGLVRGDSKSLLLVVDSLHTWTRGAASGVSEYEALNDGLRSLQMLCHQLECPALVVCEQSRAAIAGGGGVNSGAGSRFIEYGAEIVFDLQASKEASGAGEREVAVRIAKNRHGAAGMTVNLHFNGALQRFKESG